MLLFIDDFSSPLFISFGLLFCSNLILGSVIVFKISTEYFALLNYFTTQSKRFPWNYQMGHFSLSQFSEPNAPNL